MLNDIEKNLAIASMELCLQDAHRLAAIQSLATVENLVRQLRAMFSIDETNVTDAHVKLAWDMIAALETLPSRNNLSRLYRRIAPTAPAPTTSGMFDGSAVFDGTTHFDGGST